MTIKGSRSERPRRDVVNSFYLAFEGSKTEPNYLNRMSVLKMYDRSKCTFIPKSYLDLKKTSAPQVFYFLKDYQCWIENNGTRCPWDVFITLLVDKTVNKYEKLKSRICEKTIKQRSRHSEVKYKEIETISKELHNLLDAEKILLDKWHLDVRQVLPVVKDYMSKRYEPYDFEEIIPEDFEPPVSFGNNHYVMIVDRDQFTRGNESIDMVVSGCKKMQYSLIVTNPNFEFWIALHFNSYDHDKMIESIKEMIDQQSKPIEERTVDGDLGPLKYLLSLYPEYKKKTNFDFITKDMVNRAIERSKQYPSDMKTLKNKLTTDDLSSVGTNMGDLFDLLNNKRIDGYPLPGNISIYIE